MNLFDVPDADDGSTDRMAPSSKVSSTAAVAPGAWQPSYEPMRKRRRPYRWVRWTNHNVAEAQCWRCGRTECLKLISVKENRFECSDGEACERRCRNAAPGLYDVD